MNPDELLYPVILYDGQAYFLERSDTFKASFFGGPFEGMITGVKHGPRRLHHIATIDGDTFEPLWHIVGMGGLHLVYGMCYDGCRLKYRGSAAGVKLLEMEPTTSTPNWPYLDYPAHLPYFPLRLQKRVKCAAHEFSELCSQPLKVRSSEAVVVVPPTPTLGMSLWGPSGDAECKQIVFRCNLKTRPWRRTTNAVRGIESSAVRQANRLRALPPRFMP